MDPNEMTPDEVERAIHSHLFDIRIAMGRSVDVYAEIERELRKIVDSPAVRDVLDALVKKA